MSSWGGIPSACLIEPLSEASISSFLGIGESIVLGPFLEMAIEVYFGIGIRIESWPCLSPISNLGFPCRKKSLLIVHILIPNPAFDVFIPEVSTPYLSTIPIGSWVYDGLDIITLDLPIH